MRETNMICKCGYRHFKSLRSINTAHGCDSSGQSIINWGLKQGIFDEHPVCIIRRKKCNRCGAVIRTIEYQIATETKKPKTTWGGKEIRVRLLGGKT